ncbi:unnamed protein product, partial [Brenthis ino]
MDEAQKDLSQSSEIKNILPDVVHSQQISSLEAVVERNTDSEADTTQQTHESQGNDIQDVEDVSATESISEHIPFKGEYSITESEPGQSLSQHGLLKVELNSEQESKSSLNIPLSHQKNINSPNIQESQHSASWNLDANQSDVHISEESPVILALSSDTSKELLKTKSQSSSSSNHDSDESPRSEYIDSLNDNSSHQSLDGKENDDNFKEKSNLSMDKGPDSIEQCSSGSEEIIKLDIRGQAAPKYPFQAAKIFFGPPPDGSTIVGPNLEPLPVFQTLLSPCLVGASDGVTVEEVFEEKSECIVKEASPEKSLSPSVCSVSDKIEQDVLVEEMTVEDEIKEKNYEGTTPPKSFAPEDMSFNTMSTDYKTICEEYHVKLVHLEEAIAHRDQLIEELTLSLQRSVQDRDGLKHENEHLANEVQNLQHAIAERSNSDHDTMKGQLSDYVKYQTMLKEDTTKFYSALMSGTTSLQSSNGEKDMDRDEITVNYSKSDLRSTGSSDEFQTGFENKLTSLLNTFEGYIEESLRNKLRESLIQVLCDEIGKMRVEYDTDVKELESQVKQEKQTYTTETRKLRELLSSVKAGNADIDELRMELSIKHEKEMENLRTYFEKKCSDMERSYSEEVWRGRAAVSPPPEPELAAGDARRRTRSVDFPAWSFETSTPIENTLKLTNKKLEQQLEDLKAEHITYINELQARHKETIADLEEQITQLKAHIQTAENTEGHVSSLYQQDIDLELEKVLLSDPDAELSSWPLELVALRDRIHAEKTQDKEVLFILYYIRS